MFCIILCMLQGHHQNIISVSLCTFTTILGYVDRCFKPPIVICYCSITVLLSAVALYCSCRTTVVNVVKWVIIHTLSPKSALVFLESQGFLVVSSFLLILDYVNNVVINVQNFVREGTVFYY